MFFYFICYHFQVSMHQLLFPFIKVDRKILNSIKTKQLTNFCISFFSSLFLFCLLSLVFLFKNLLKLFNLTFIFIIQLCCTCNNEFTTRICNFWK